MKKQLEGLGSSEPCSLQRLEAGENTFRGQATFDLAMGVILFQNGFSFFFLKSRTVDGRVEVESQFYTKEYPWKPTYRQARPCPAEV